ncbi:MAG: hypothetical protein OXK80_05480 [Bdellovibrionales bacterium]|nr:hypothetical protein [Bdellovibrionales bacterium]
MKTFVWLIVLFFSVNGYSYLGEDLSGSDQCNVGSVDTQTLQAIGSVNEFVNHVDSDMHNCMPGSLQTTLLNDNLSLKDVLTRTRECLLQRLLDVTQQICQFKKNIRVASENCVNVEPAIYERTQKRLAIIENLHVYYRELLLDRTDFWRSKADESDNPFRQNEYGVYSEIFESASHINCL